MSSLRLLGFVAIVSWASACSDKARAPTVDPWGFDAAPGAVADSAVDDAKPTVPAAETILAITRVADAKVWGTQLERILAADKNERVFVSDGKSIFVFEGGVASRYVTSEDLQAHFAVTAEPRILALDVDADGKLYVLASTTKRAVLEIPAAHEVVRFADVSVFGRLTVVSPDRLLATDYDGL